jgi:hypothetical protein
MAVVRNIPGGKYSGVTTRIKAGETHALEVLFVDASRMYCGGSGRRAGSNRCFAAGSEWGSVLQHRLGVSR